MKSVIHTKLTRSRSNKPVYLQSPIPNQARVNNIVVQLADPDPDSLCDDDLQYYDHEVCTKIATRHMFTACVYVVRWKVMFILGNVCLSTGRVPNLEGGTYPEWGVPTLDGEYLSWTGGTNLGQGGTYPELEVPTPPSPQRQSSTVSTCYMTCGMPLAFTLQDLLVMRSNLGGPMAIAVFPVFCKNSGLDFSNRYIVLHDVHSL